MKQKNAFFLYNFLLNNALENKKNIRENKVNKEE